MNIRQIVKEVFSNIKRDWYLPVTEHRVYSEQEQVVGVWTDGKPLYEKTIVVTPTRTKGQWHESIVLPNDCVIVQVYNAYETDATGWSSPLNFTSSAQYLIQFNNNVLRTYTTDTAHLSIPITATLHYTKTTDTPTTKKVPFEPLVEYSTDEKMIGYWVDGKPLYRKTIELDKTCFVANSEKSVAHGISNLDNIISKYGFCYRRANGVKTRQTIPQSYYGSTAWNLDIQDINDTNMVIQVGNRWGNQIEYGAVTLEYTKTTD